MSLKVHRPLKSQLPLILLILLVAAAIRIADLTRLPPGFNDDEIRGIQVAETTQQGVVASLYNVGDPAGGYEGLYPTLQGILTSLIGDGLLCYRILSMWCGLISVALMYALARRLFGHFAGLGAAVALAVTFWPVLLSRSAIREALLLPLVLALLLIMARALHLSRKIEPEAPMTAPYTMLGVLMVMTIYTHWTGILTVPLVVVFLIYLIVTHQPISRRVLSFTGFAFLVAIILGIPYLTFSLRAPALSALHVFWANRPENVVSLLNSTARTVGSLFLAGDPLPQHNMPGSPLIGPLGSVLLLIGLLTAIRRWRWPNMALMLLTLLIGLLPGLWSRGEPNFTYTILALPAIMALVGLGALVAAQQAFKLNNLTGNGRALLAGAAIAAVSLYFTSTALFQQWPRSQGVDQAYYGRLGRLAAYLDRNHDGLTTSICTLNLTSADSRKPSDPALLDLMLHRRSPDVRFSNCLTALVLTRGGGLQRFAFADREAAKAASPLFRFWLDKGQPVPADGLAPGTVLILNVEKELADLAGKLTLGHVEWAPESVGVPSSTRATLPVRMGGYLTFEGYQLPAGSAYRPGDTVTLVTYWRADGPQEPDLRVFAHILRNPFTEPILQNDVLSVEASRLRDRDVFMQIISIPLPLDFPAGEYHLSIGAYRSSDETRLPVYDANDEHGDRLFLDTINVE